MLIKYCSVKFATMNWDEVKQRYPDFTRRVATNMIPIDPGEYLYIRNESVHCEEYYGPNHNGDGFGLDEMRNRYHTFRKARSTIDHRDDLIIGEVLDTVFVEPIFTKTSGSDEEQFSGGGLIENLIGISYQKVENLEKQKKIKPGFIDNILAGKITDTSMGAIVSYSECSICGHIAHNEDEYCEHILGGKNREIITASGEKKKVWEKCYGVTWFEDSVIVPLELGGLAGGEGADKDAKIKNIVTQSQDYETRLDKLYRLVVKHGSDQDIQMLEEIFKMIL